MFGLTLKFQVKSVVISPCFMVVCFRFLRQLPHIHGSLGFNILFSFITVFQNAVRLFGALQTGHSLLHSLETSHLLDSFSEVAVAGMIDNSITDCG